MTIDVVAETTETNFSQFWSLGSLTQECWPIQLPSEGSILTLKTANVSLCPHRAVRETANSGVSSHKMGAPSA